MNNTRNAEQIFLLYTSRYNVNDPKIGLKIRHTFKVAKNIDTLSASLKLDEEMRMLAHLTAIYHDIGRFEQVKRYGTFQDALSIDHADLGVAILKASDFLNHLTDKQKQMIYTAIKYHNKFDIPENLDEKTKTLCKMIRDADKQDIIRVAAQEDFQSVCESRQEELANDTISEAVYESIMNHRCINKKDRKTGLDILMTYLGFFFDVNYDKTIEEIVKEGYYKAPYTNLSIRDAETRKQIENMLKSVDAYIVKRLSH